MAQYLLVQNILILLYFNPIFSTQDVEIFDDIIPTAPWNNGDEESIIQTSSFVKAVRNKHSNPTSLNNDFGDISHFMQKVAIARLLPRKKRDVIEEEKYYNSRHEGTTQRPWMPESIASSEETELGTIKSDDVENIQGFQLTTEPLIEKQTGREARGAISGQWIKLPVSNRDETEKDQLIAPKPINDDMSSRMPRIDFVTQNKHSKYSGPSDSSGDRDSIARASNNHVTDLRSDFLQPPENRARSLYYDDKYGRQPSYNVPYFPEDFHRQYLYENRNYRDEDYTLNRIPEDDSLFSPRYPDLTYRSRLDRYDIPISYDAPIIDSQLRKPKRIIYYANLPEVVRTPPNVDLRYKFTPDLYRRIGSDVYRDGRYDYRFKSRNDRYPYGELTKVDAKNRDLISSGSEPKDNKHIIDHRETTIKPVDEKKLRNMKPLNSHQYPLEASTADMHFNKPARKIYSDVPRYDRVYRRYDDLSPFGAALDDPFIDRHD